MKSPYNNEKILRELYQKYGNGRLIAEALGLQKSQVYRWLKNYKITNRDLKRRSVTINYFENIDTEKKAYYLGLLMSDGCVYRGASKNSYCMQINLKSTDKNELDKFKEELQSTYDYLTYSKTLDSGEEATYLGLKISNTEFCHHLMSHGIIPRKSFKKKMPDIPKELERHFIRGYFDGDGGLYNNPNRFRNGKGCWEVTIVGTPDILQSFQDILLENDINSAIYQTKTSGIMRLVISKHEMIEKFRLFIYIDSTVHFDRKFQKFNDFKTAQMSC